MNNLVQTPLLVVSNLVLIFLLYRLTKPAFQTGYLSRYRINLAIFFCFIFCLFSFWGADWFGYQAYFRWVKNGLASQIPMEDFYVMIMESCSYYLQFRVIVWGLALLLFILTLRNLKLNVGLSLFFFCSIYLIYFSYARATLAMAMMFYGYSYIFINENKSFSITSLLGFILIFVSFFLHKSALLGIAAIVCSFIILIFKRKGAIILLISFPFFILGMNLFFSDYFIQIANSDESTLSDYAQAGAGYLEKSNTAFSIGAFVQKNLFEQVPYYLLAICCFREIRKPSVLYSKSMMAYVVLLFTIVLTSLIFLFDLGVDTSVFFGRYLRFAQIPACIILTFMYSNGVQRKLIKWVYSLAIFGCFYCLIYVVYNKLV